METLWSSAVSYYGSSKKYDNVIRFSVQLSENIDFSLFSEAVQRASVRFPYLSVSREVKGGAIVLLENEIPWPVFYTDRPALLGSPETCGHMLAFSVQKDWFYLDCFHGLMDARAAGRVIKTVLYLYISGKYRMNFEVPDLLLPGEAVSKEEADDPTLRRYPKLRYRAFSRILKTAFCPGILHLKKNGSVKTDGYETYKLRVSQESLMQYCSMYDSSPATALCLMLARSIRSVHRDSKKEITGGVLADLRPALNVKLSHHSSIMTIGLPFDRKTEELPFEKQGTVYRGRLILENDPERMLDNLSVLNLSYGVINRLPGLRLKQFFTRQMVHRVLSRNTYLVSYAGYSRFGGMEPFIKSCYTDVDLWDSGIMLEINAFSNVFCLSFSQEWKESLYFDAFLKELERHNIDYSLVFSGPCPLPKVLQI